MIILPRKMNLFPNFFISRQKQQLNVKFVMLLPLRKKLKVQYLFHLLNFILFFSPFDLTEPQFFIDSIPSTSHIIFQFQKQKYVLETVPINENEKYCVIIIKSTSQKYLSGPFLISIQQNFDINILKNVISERFHVCFSTDMIEVLKNELNIESLNEPIIGFLPDSVFENNFKNLRESKFTSSNLSINSLFSSFFSRSILDDKNKWLCQACSNETNAIQQIKIIDIPKCAVLH